MASHSELRRIHFRVVRFMMECGIKLGMKSVPLASAAQIYHRFFQETELHDYDPYLIGMTSLYLAGKVEEEHLKLRDVINVCHRSLHRNREPLDIGEEYWAMRDSVVQTELLIMRMLQFQVNFNHPHKYLLHYLKSLHDWLDPDTVKHVPVAHTAWAILRDSYHSDLSLRFQAEHIAVAVLYLALQMHGVDVPYSNKAEKKWWEALSEDITLEWMRTITNQIIDTYDMETTVR